MAVHARTFAGVVLSAVLFAACSDSPVAPPASAPSVPAAATEIISGPNNGYRLTLTQNNCAAIPYWFREATTGQTFINFAFCPGNGTTWQVPAASADLNLALRVYGCDPRFCDSFWELPGTITGAYPDWSIQYFCFICTPVRFPFTLLVHANQPPVVNVGGPYEGVEGVPLAINVTATDPDGDPVTVLAPTILDANGDAAILAPGGPGQFVFPDGPATYRVFASASDGVATAGASTTITIANAPPAVTAVSTPPTGQSGQSFDATFHATDVQGDGPWQLEVRWNDGTSTTRTLGALGDITASHAYYGGAHTYEFRVTDKDGGVGTATAQIAVADAPPVAIPGGPYQVDEGRPVTLDGSGSTDPDGDTPLTFAWDFGDGTPPAAGAVVQHVYADNGAFAPVLTVTDPSGAATHASASVIVRNVAPVVDAGADAAVDVGAPFALAGGFTDVAGDGPFTYRIAWGDGAVVTGTAAHPSAIDVTHAYAASGGFDVELTVTDKDGAQGTDQARVTVRDQPPTAAFGVGGSLTEGGTVSFDGGASHDPEGGALQYAWSFGDGTPPLLGGAGATHVYANSGVYAATLTVIDPSGLHGTATQSLTVANLPPAVDAGPALSALQGDAATLMGSFGDVAGDGVWSIEVDWGDGTSSSSTSGAPGSFTAAHVCAAPGVFHVTAAVTDRDGGRGSAATTLACARIPLTVDVNPNAINLRGNGNGTITVRVPAAGRFDPLAIDPASVRLGDGSAMSVGLTQKANGSLKYDVSSREATLFFDRSALIAAGVLRPGTTRLVLWVALRDGRAFEGTGDVRVLP